MATIRKMSPAKRRGISTILLTIIVALIGVGLSGTIYVVFNEQIAGITSQTNLSVSGFSIDLNDDRLSVSGNIQNLGQSPVRSVVVEELVIGDFIFRQNFDLDDDDPDTAHGHVYFEGEGCDGSANTEQAWASTTAYDCDGASPPATIDPSAQQRLTGVSLSQTDLQDLEGGGASAFRLVIDSDAGSTDLDLSNSIDIGDQGSIVLRYLVGNSEQITDTFQARVK